MFVTPDGQLAAQSRAAQARRQRAHKTGGAGNGGNKIPLHKTIDTLLAELKKARPGNWGIEDGGIGKYITYFGLPVVMINNALKIHDLHGRIVRDGEKPLQLKIDNGDGVQFASEEAITQMVPILLKLVPPVAFLIDELNSLSPNEAKWEVSNNGEGIRLAMNRVNHFALSGSEVLTLNGTKIAELKPNRDDAELKIVAERLLGCLALTRALNSLKQLKPGLWSISSSDNGDLYSITHKPEKELRWGYSPHHAVYFVVNGENKVKTRDGRETGVQLVTNGTGGLKLADPDETALILSDLTPTR